MRILAAIDQPGVIRGILECLDLSSRAPPLSPALSPEPTDLGQLVTDVADTHRRRAAEANVDVEVATPEASVEAVVDPVRMREVVTNLVVNALRAMPDGGTLRLEASRADDGPVISVTDTGVGIEPDELDRVFDRFHKSSGSGGSGLGLSISRDLVAAHGGTLTIDSDLGTGTVVRVDLSAEI